MNPWQLWTESLQDPTAKWVVILFLLTCLVLGGLYVAKWFRDLAIGSGTGPVGAIDHLSEFEKLYLAGKIDQEEFLKLKKNVPRSLMLEMGLEPKTKLPSLQATESTTEQTVWADSANPAGPIVVAKDFQKLTPANSSQADSSENIEFKPIDDDGEGTSESGTDKMGRA